MLTEDELRMLLSGDPAEDGPYPIRPTRHTPDVGGKGGGA